MKYIFLDIDGVLNTQDSWIRLYQINQALVKRLSQVVEKTNAKIVLTSSWRKGWDSVNPTPQIQKLQEIFKVYHMEIIGVTPDLKSRKRDDEINRYLYFNPCDDYIIIDDDKNEFGNLSKVYLIDAKVGLTDKDVKKIIKLLK